MVTEEDIKYMKRAIELAGRGCGFVNPNPLVGAVIVKNGKVIGEGWHERYGGLHAERNAFLNCNDDAKGATMYVTLEPCCHYGKTPPCTDAVIENGIAKVVVGMKDPNPLVAGKGIEILRQKNIEVITGVEEEVIREQNRIFLKYIATKQPWVMMKTAMTLDGKIAAFTGDSRWVTGDESRYLVHKLRAKYMAVLTGSGTVIADNPMLNSRLEENIRQPIRVIVDSHAGIGLNSKIVISAFEYPTIIAHTRLADKTKLNQLQEKGLETLLCDDENGKVSIKSLLEQLGNKGIDSVMLESGGRLNEAFVRGNFVDEVYVFIAPKIIGGKDALTPVEGHGIEKMSDAVRLTNLKIEKIGEDILITGKVNK